MYPILIKDIKILSVYAVVSFVLGITLKGPLNKVTDKVMEKLLKSGILRH